MDRKKIWTRTLLILGFVIITLAGFHTISNPEIFTHIALGQAENGSAPTLSYTMENQQWIDLHPLYNKLASLLWAIGGTGLITLFHVTIVMIAFMLMLRLGRNWGGALSQGLTLLLCTWLIIPVFNPGPTAFFLLFTALFMTLLYRIKNGILLSALLLILQVLWTHMHPSFLLGPLLILISAIENGQRTHPVSRTSIATPLTKRLFALAGIALLITVINPNLLHLHRHIFANWKVLTGTEGLEWISLFSNGFPQNFMSRLLLFALVLGAGGLITLQKKLPLMITATALIGAFLTVLSIGALPAFTVLAFPFLILSFSAIGEYLTRTLSGMVRMTQEMWVQIMTLVTLTLMVVTLAALITNSAYTNMGSASQFGLGLQKDAFPVSAAAILDREDFPKRMINIPHDGGYLAVQHPQHKVFCDTRISFYSPNFYKMLNQALLGQSGAWKALLSDWDPHAMVLNGVWQGAGALANRLISAQNKEGVPRWKLVYFDGATLILVRNLPEYETLINDPSIQQDGSKLLKIAQQKYQAGNQGLFKTGNSSRLIAAGSLYLALNRPAEAEAIYSLLVQHSPRMATAWLGLGQSLIFQKQLTKGLQSIEKAASMTPRNAQIWIALLQAYQMKNDEPNIRKATEKLNKFFQADQATIEQQETAKPKKQTARRAAAQREDDFDLPAELQ